MMKRVYSIIANIDDEQAEAIANAAYDNWAPEIQQKEINAGRRLAELDFYFGFKTDLTNRNPFFVQGYEEIRAQKKKMRMKALLQNKSIPGLWDHDEDTLD